MAQKSPNELNPALDKRKRHWHPKDEREEQVLKRFLSLCTEKLTFALMSSLTQDDIQNQIDRILNEEVSFDELAEFDTDEFFDLLIGQRRLFDDAEE